MEKLQQLELDYLSGGLADILKGATIEGVYAMDDGDDVWLGMRVRFPTPIEFNGQPGVTGMNVSIMQDPEGNGPGALAADAIYYPIEP